MWACVDCLCEQPCMHTDESSSHPACTLTLRYTFIPSWYVHGNHARNRTGSDVGSSDTIILSRYCPFK
jgi:hypothetical protein